MDMFQYLYNHNNRSRKWRHRVLFAVIEMILVNSPSSYSEMYGKIQFLDFKREVTQRLLIRGITYAKTQEDQSRRHLPHIVISPTT